jgi:hypothetical protein
MSPCKEKPQGENFPDVVILPLTGSLVRLHAREMRKGHGTKATVLQVIQIVVLKWKSHKY